MCWIGNFCRARGAISWPVLAGAPDLEPPTPHIVSSSFTSFLAQEHSSQAPRMPPLSSQRVPGAVSCLRTLGQSSGSTTLSTGRTSWFFADSQSRSSVEVRRRRHLGGWEALWKGKTTGEKQGRAHWVREDSCVYCQVNIWPPWTPEEEVSMETLELGTLAVPPDSLGASWGERTRISELPWRVGRGSSQSWPVSQYHGDEGKAELAELTQWATWLRSSWSLQGPSSRNQVSHSIQKMSA